MLQLWLSWYLRWVSGYNNNIRNSFSVSISLLILCCIGFLSYPAASLFSESGDSTPKVVGEDKIAADTPIASVVKVEGNSGTESVELEEEIDTSLIFPELPPLTFLQRSRIGVDGGFAYPFEQATGSQKFFLGNFSGRVWYRFIPNERKNFVLDGILGGEFIPMKNPDFSYALQFNLGARFGYDFKILNWLHVIPTGEFSISNLYEYSKGLDEKVVVFAPTIGVNATAQFQLSWRHALEFSLYARTFISEKSLLSTGANIGYSMRLGEEPPPSSKT